MRVLAVAPQPFFVTRGTPFSIYYRTLVMAEQGVQIDLLTYGVGKEVDIPGVRVIRIPSPGPLGRNIPIGPSFKKACLDTLMVFWTIALLLRQRYDLVHAHEEAVFWCRWLKPIFRFRLVYDMHSSLPQQLINFDYSRSILLHGAFRWAEHVSLRAADAVITICPDLAEYATRHGVKAGRHFLIENSIFDRISLKEKVHNGAAKPQSSAIPSGHAEPVLTAEAEGPRIVYTGTLETYQGLDLLIRAMPHILPEWPDAQLILVGGTASQIAAMNRLAQQVGVIHACRFTGILPKDQAQSYVHSADVLVSPRLRGTNTPLKIYEWLTSGVPIVATNIWSHAQILDEHVSVLVEPDPLALAEGMLTVLRDPALAEQLTAAAQSLYRQRYSRSVYERKIRDLLGVLQR